MIRAAQSFLFVAVLASGVAACSGSDATNTDGGAGAGLAGAGLGASGGASGASQSGGTAGNPVGGNPAGGANAGGAAATGGATPSGGSSSLGGTAGMVTAGGSSAGASSAGAAGTTADCSAKPVDPDAIPEAKKLLCYLYGIYGNHVLSGQQETSWSNPQGDVDYYVQTVGKHPAILGGDYLYQDGPKPGGNTTQRAKAYWDAGGLTMMRYHMGAPPNSDTYDNSKGTVANFDNLTQAGTAENSSLNSKLDYLAGELKVLEDEKVPVLMVIYHEVDKYAWFWWSKGSGAQFVKLWKYSIDYVNKTKGVHNVLWVMGYGHDGAIPEYYPGKDFVDLGGIDEYDHGTQPFTSLYSGTKAVVGAVTPIPLHETGTIPQPSAMFPSAAPWLLWNVWATYENTDAEGYTWNTAEAIKSAYADAHTITRETLPSQK